jgi:hypothetical protein
MSSIMKVQRLAWIERHQAYGDLMDQVSDAIRDRNEEALSTLTDESERIIHAMQDAWSDVLARAEGPAPGPASRVGRVEGPASRVEAHPFDIDRDGEIGRLAKSVERALDKVRTAEKELAQWGSELGTSLGTVNQGRNALRGYAIGKGR